jgi:hypothetical protein
MQIISILGLALILMSCGKEEQQTNPISSTDITPTGESLPAEENQPVDEIVLQDCVIDSWDIPLTPCASIRKNGTLLSRNHLTDTAFEFTASKKNGGAGGTRWFDAKLEWNIAKNFLLPTEIFATGNAGNGQKLYIKFNDSLDCVWYSHAGIKYRNPRCFLGASRAPGNSVGFSGGSEVASSHALGVKKIWVSVNGASGNGVVTTVNSNFQIY